MHPLMPLAGVVGWIVEVKEALDGDLQILMQIDGDLDSEEVLQEGGFAPEIAFHFCRSVGGVEGSVRYQASLFEQQTIERMIGSWDVLVREVDAFPDKAIGSLALLPPSEEATRQRWNDTAADFPAIPAHELFEEQVKRTPDACAVVFRGKRTSYFELDSRASRLAQALRLRGVDRETPVGVYMNRSLDSLVAILGIWKAGGAYVPLDLTYPPAHIRLILEETEAPLLITDKENAEVELGACSADLLCIDALPETAYRGVGGRVDELASIFYTSGSTGQPKGVAVSHHYHLRRLGWCWADYPFQSGDVMAQTTSSFVVSMWEFLGGLLQGIPT